MLSHSRERKKWEMCVKEEGRKRLKKVNRWEVRFCVGCAAEEEGVMEGEVEGKREGRE